MPSSSTDDNTGPEQSDAEDSEKSWSISSSPLDLLFRCSRLICECVHGRFVELRLTFEAGHSKGVVDGAGEVSMW